MKYVIKEQFVRGKYDDQNRCEDIIHLSENFNKEVIAKDPLMYHIVKQVKGMRSAGGIMNESFDDRSYVSFELV